MEIVLVLSVPMIIWMILVWSHLREQTKYLKKIAEGK